MFEPTLNRRHFLGATVAAGAAFGLGLRPAWADEPTGKRADDQGVTCVLIMIDGEGDLSARDDAKRSQAVEGHKKWVDAAAALGCHSIRVNTGSNYGPDDVATAADGCGRLVDYGIANKIN